MSGWQKMTSNNIENMFVSFFFGSPCSDVICGSAQAAPKSLNVYKITMLLTLKASSKIKQCSMPATAPDKVP